MRERRSRQQKPVTVVLEYVSDARVDQSAVDGAPQCPSCYAHLMRKRNDGSFECPGCHEVAIRVRAPTSSLGRARTFVGRLGDTFVTCGNA